MQRYLGRGRCMSQDCASCQGTIFELTPTTRSLYMRPDSENSSPSPVGSDGLKRRRHENAYTKEHRSKHVPRSDLYGGAERGLGGQHATGARARLQRPAEG